MRECKNEKNVGGYADTAFAGGRSDAYRLLMRQCINNSELKSSGSPAAGYGILGLIH